MTLTMTSTLIFYFVIRCLAGNGESSFDAALDRQLRDSEMYNNEGKKSTESLFQDNRKVAVDAEGRLENILIGSQSLEPPSTRQDSYRGTNYGKYESASLVEARQARNPEKEEEKEEKVETEEKEEKDDENERHTEGAPAVGFKNCAINGEKCYCPEGYVRYGLHSIDDWTQPIFMGDKEEVTCDLEALKKVRVHFDDKEGPEQPRSCECITRVIQISTNSALSLLEVEAAIKERRQTSVLAASKKCLSVKHAHGSNTKDMVDATKAQEEETDSTEKTAMMEKAAMVAIEEQLTGTEAPTTEDDQAEKEKEAHSDTLLDNEMSSQIQLLPCEHSDEEQWMFLLSSGQIRHSGTGRCIGAFFTEGDKIGKVMATDCTLSESQMQVQRWAVPFYHADEASMVGKIRLAYGASTDHALCLTTHNDALGMARCSESETDFAFTRLEPHVYADCGAEEEMCECAGEIRFGEADQNVWTPSVPVPSLQNQGSVTQCDLPELRFISMKDPVGPYGEAEEPDKRQCQCAASTDMKKSDLSVKDKAKGKKVTEEAPAGSMTMIIIYISSGVLVLLLCVVIFMQLRKRSGGGDEWGEWDGEEYEEAWGEEGEYDYEEEEEG